MNSPGGTTWYENGLRFACTQCGNCCSGAPGYVWVSTAELETIAAHRGLTPEAFARRHTRRVGRRISLLEHHNGDCEFLVSTPEGKRICGIYPVRPLQCRTWPFWDSNLERPGDWAHAGLKCPGINRGLLHALPVIQAALANNDEAALPL
ncbi:MAG TPA: YkgJ family cysteine cluster protein [Phycisphaerae bacterium]|nr:YkgJ family cysteine cluster protein [Phycisphaerae bacterium]